MRRLTIFVTLLLLLLVPAGAALAGPLPDRVVEEDETVREDVTLFGEDLLVAAGGQINGDVALMGGDAEIAGTIKGDLVLFGGNLTLTETAVVTGECAVLGGSLTETDGSDARCTHGDLGMGLPGALNRVFPQFPSPPTVPERVEPPVNYARYDSIGAVAGVLGRTLALGLAALIAGAILPNHLMRVSQAVSRKPVISGTVGLLTAAAGASLLALLALISALLILACLIGLFGFPVLFLGGLLLAGAALFGWVAVGNLVGEWLLARLRAGARSRAMTAAIGTAALTLGLGLLGLLPFFIGGFAEPVLFWILLSVGLGATALTQFGTKPYPRAALSAEKVTAVLDSLPDQDKPAL